MSGSQMSGMAKRIIAATLEKYKDDAFEVENKYGTRGICFCCGAFSQDFDPNDRACKVCGETDVHQFGFAIVEYVLDNWGIKS